jgi:hypothetical protein
LRITHHASRCAPCDRAKGRKTPADSDGHRGVITSVHDGRRVLRQSDPLFSVPLIVAVIVLLAFG